jgi:hypothetical protein
MTKVLASLPTPLYTGLPDMAFAGVVRHRQVDDGHIVEVAAAQVVDIVSDCRELEAEKSLAGTEVAKMKQKMDLRADRATLLERLAFRRCQREEQLPVALGETRKAPEQLVFFWRKDLQAITLRDGLIIGVVKRKVGHATAGWIWKSNIITDARTSMLGTRSRVDAVGF